MTLPEIGDVVLYGREDGRMVPAIVVAVADDAELRLDLHVLFGAEDVNQSVTASAELRQNVSHGRAYGMWLPRRRTQ